jgi:hypothetical protein
MIYPFTVGPMAISTVTWFQGESNNDNSGFYACAQPAMIRQWRAAFNSDFFFGFVLLEPWISGFTRTHLPAFRQEQLAALALPKVAFASATDIGDPLGPFGSVHPRNKKAIGRRLANAALSVQYGVSGLPWQYPAYLSATATGSGASASATVLLSNVPSTLLPREDHCATEHKVDPAQCAGFYLVGSDGVQYAAVATVGGGEGGGSNALHLAAALPPGVTVSGTTFGFSTWPINTVATAEGLPLMPWNVTAVA